MALNRSTSSLTFHEDEDKLPTLGDLICPSDDLFESAPDKPEFLCSPSDLMNSGVFSNFDLSAVMLQQVKTKKKKKTRFVSPSTTNTSMDSDRWNASIESEARRNDVLESYLPSTDVLCPPDLFESMDEQETMGSFSFSQDYTHDYTLSPREDNTLSPREESHLAGSSHSLSLAEEPNDALIDSNVEHQESTSPPPVIKTSPPKSNRIEYVLQSYRTPLKKTKVRVDTPETTSSDYSTTTPPPYCTHKDDAAKWSPTKQERHKEPHHLSPLKKTLEEKFKTSAESASLNQSNWTEDSSDKITPPPSYTRKNSLAADDAAKWSPVKENHHNSSSSSDVHKKSPLKAQLEQKFKSSPLKESPNQSTTTENSHETPRRLSPLRMKLENKFKSSPLKSSRPAVEPAAEQSDTSLSNLFCQEQQPWEETPPKTNNATLETAEESLLATVEESILETVEEFVIPPAAESILETSFEQSFMEDGVEQELSISCIVQNETDLHEVSEVQEPFWTEREWSGSFGEGTVSHVALEISTEAEDSEDGLEKVLAVQGVNDGNEEENDGKDELDTCFIASQLVSETSLFPLLKDAEEDKKEQPENVIPAKNAEKQDGDELVAESDDDNEDFGGYFLGESVSQLAHEISTEQTVEKDGNNKATVGGDGKGVVVELFGSDDDVAESILEEAVPAKVLVDKDEDKEATVGIGGMEELVDVGSGDDDVTGSFLEKVLPAKELVHNDDDEETTVGRDGKEELVEGVSGEDDVAESFLEEAVNQLALEISVKETEDKVVVVEKEAVNRDGKEERVEVVGSEDDVPKSFLEEAVNQLALEICTKETEEKVVVEDEGVSRDDNEELAKDVGSNQDEDVGSNDEDKDIGSNDDEVAISEKNAPENPQDTDNPNDKRDYQLGAVLRNMHKYPKRKVLQQHGMKVLMEATNENSNPANMLPRGKGIPIILAAMQRFPFERMLQFRCLRTLCNLSDSEVNAETLVFKHNGIPIIVANMTEYSKDTEMAVTVSSLFAKLGQFRQVKKPVVEAKAVRLLADILEENDGNVKAQEAIRDAIKALL